MKKATSTKTKLIKHTDLEHLFNNGSSSIFGLDFSLGSPGLGIFLFAHKT